MDWDDTYILYRDNQSLTITAIQVNHPGDRYRYDQYRKCNGYILESDGIAGIFIGDTTIGVDLKNIDVIKDMISWFIPIGAYNPYQHRHCNPEEALNIAEILNVSVYCQYTMGHFV